MAGYANSKKNRIIYLYITDHINKYPYKLLDIPTYTEELSDYELSPYTGGPIRHPIPGEVSSGMYTISWMIDAYHNRTPFSFEKPSDVCHVAWKLEDYTNRLKEKQGITKEEQRYLDKALTFLSYIKRQAKIILSRYNKLKLLKEQDDDTLFDQFLEAVKEGNNL